MSTRPHTGSPQLRVLWLVFLIVAANGIADTDPRVKNLLSQQTLLSDYLDAADFGNALTVSGAMLGEVQGYYGTASREYASALYNHGLVLRHLDRDPEALDSFERSLAIREDLGGPYAASVHRALKQLGRLFFDTGDHEQALGYFRRAQHITHRLDGVYTPQQLEIVDWITQIQVASGQIRAADTQQRYAYLISERSFAEDSRRMLDASVRLGNWLRATGQYRDARTMYTRALRLAEAGDSRAERIPVLRALASLGYISGNCCPEEPLVQALTIMEEDGADTNDRIEATVELADMHLVKRKVKKAKELYRKALALITKENFIARHLRELFHKPVALGVRNASATIDAYYDSRPTERLRRRDVVRVIVPERTTGASLSFGGNPAAEERVVGHPIPLCLTKVRDLANLKDDAALEDMYLEYRFDVDVDGDVSGIEMTAGNVPVGLERYVRYSLERMRYRPTMDAEGNFTPSSASVRQTFGTATAKQQGPKGPLDHQRQMAAQGCLTMLARA